MHVYGVHIGSRRAGGGRWCGRVRCGAKCTVRVLGGAAVGGGAAEVLIMRVGGLRSASWRCTKAPACASMPAAGGSQEVGVGAMDAFGYISKAIPVCPVAIVCEYICAHAIPRCEEISWPCRCKCTNAHEWALVQLSARPTSDSNCKQCTPSARVQHAVSPKLMGLFPKILYTKSKKLYWSVYMHGQSQCSFALKR